MFLVVTVQSIIWQRARRAVKMKEEGIDRTSWRWLAQEKPVGGRICNQQYGRPQ